MTGNKLSGGVRGDFTEMTLKLSHYIDRNILGDYVRTLVQTKEKYDISQVILYRKSHHNSFIFLPMQGKKKSVITDEYETPGRCRE